MNSKILFVGLGVGVLFAPSLRTQGAGAGDVVVPAQGNVPTQSAPADNTARNRRDRSVMESTADQQSMNKRDTDLTAAIRRDVVADPSLSTYAQNIKIITVNGRVTLKGPVRSDAEKNTIESKAARVAGAGNVVNEMEVVPSE